MITVETNYNTELARCEMYFLYKNKVMLVDCTQDKTLHAVWVRLNNLEKDDDNI